MRSERPHGGGWTAGRRSSRAVLALLVAPTVLLPIRARPALAQSEIDRRIQESQERLGEIRREREQLDRQASELSGQVHTLSEEIRNLERQIGSSASALAELDIQIQAYGAQISETTADMLNTRDGLTVRKTELAERLREIYRRGPLHAIQVLLGARSFGELISRYKYLHLVARYDRALVSRVRKLEALLEEHRAELDAESRRLAALRSDKSREVSELEDLERQRQRRLSGARQRERKARSRLSELARDEERLMDLMAELERARREAERLAGAASTSTLTTADLGRLNWPVEGAVAYTFGPERDGNVTRVRKGIGITAPEGTPVRAVESGRVEWAGPRGLNGQTVFLSHGGGYWSIYLFLEDLRVRVGEDVSAGTILGAVGGDGSRASAFMELRILEPGPEGKPREVDPVPWLKGRS
ncbi:MAG: murein hydrolase activator EnvC family protein [Gemmatimonadota bacterium]